MGGFVIDIQENEVSLFWVIFVRSNCHFSVGGRKTSPPTGVGLSVITEAMELILLRTVVSYDGSIHNFRNMLCFKDFLGN